MAVYRQVHTTFWQDPEMIEYTPEEKYFYLYLMTNPHTTQCGIYEISKKLVSIELGYPMDTVSILLQKFIDRGKILYSESTKEVFLINWLKYNSLKSPKVMSCVEKELRTVKNKEFLRLFRDLCIQYGYPIDTLSIDYGEEKEEEEEEEKEEEEEEEEEATLPPQLKDENLKQIAEAYQNNGFGILYPNQAETLLEFSEQYTTEWVVMALEKAANMGKRTLAYVKGILKGWQSDGQPNMEIGEAKSRDQPTQSYFKPFNFDL